MSAWVHSSDCRDALIEAGVAEPELISLIAFWCLQRGLVASGFQSGGVFGDSGTLERQDFPEFHQRRRIVPRFWRVAERRRSNAVQFTVDWMRGQWAATLTPERGKTTFEHYDGVMFDRPRFDDMVDALLAGSVQATRVTEAELREWMQARSDGVNGAYSAARQHFGRSRVGARLGFRAVWYDVHPPGSKRPRKRATAR